MEKELKRSMWFGFALGAGVSFSLMVLAVIGIASGLVESLLVPGSASARLVYGGLHGGEPILAILIVNAVFYGVLGALLAVFRTLLK
jgi:hypothetical protein